MTDKIAVTYQVNAYNAGGKSFLTSVPKGATLQDFLQQEAKEIEASVTRELPPAKYAQGQHPHFGEPFEIAGYVVALYKPNSADPPKLTDRFIFTKSIHISVFADLRVK